MNFGSRKIRSAGRNSGSIEVTLPAQLQLLEGVECRLSMRDGVRPEIVLQPDLGAAQHLLHELWQRLRLGLGEADEIGEFAAADFTLALLPPRHWHERPPLAYSDALAILHCQAGQGEPPAEPLARLLAYLAVAAGYRLGLQGAFALAFGDATAYVMTGVAPGLGAEFERGMAHRAFWGEGRAQALLAAVLRTDAWRQARPGLRRVYEQVYTWQTHPDQHSQARDRWYHALTAELVGG